MSATQDAIDFIRKQGAARADAIAKAIGKPIDWVSAALNGPTKDGVLVVCKVEVPGRRAINEYRISASGKPAQFTPLSRKGEATAAIGPVPPTPPVAVAAPAPRKLNGAQVHKTDEPLDRKSVYAVALTDLRAKRDYHAGEVAKIENAIEALEGLG